MCIWAVEHIEARPLPSSTLAGKITAMSKCATHNVLCSQWRAILQNGQKYQVNFFIVQAETEKSVHFMEYHGVCKLGVIFFHVCIDQYLEVYNIC